MGLKTKKCKEIISEISSTVSPMEEFAAEAGIREETVYYIKEILDQNKTDL